MMATTEIMTTKTPLSRRPVWKTLRAHFRDVRGLHLRQLLIRRYRSLKQRS